MNDYTPEAGETIQQLYLSLKLRAAERDRALDALEDMFWQHTLPARDELDEVCPQRRSCAGLRANEAALAVLVDLKGWTRINSQVGEMPAPKEGTP